MLSIGRFNERDALNNLFCTLDKMVFDICLKIISNRHEAEDAKQDILVCIFRNLETCSDENKLENWVSSISRNLCINYIKKKNLNSKAKLISISENQWLCEQIPDTVFTDALDLIISDENLKELKAAIQLLSPVQKAVIELKYFSNMTNREIAEFMDKKDINIRVTIHNAEKKLRNILNNNNLELTI
ncbi:MAG: RNA polymerase sigma factor [Candidatus Kapabacteria bacterium]|jgi:RNA polymerase sigma-70 factor (ECF subfamily)|nr:RNA polymerase sigma factor [Candidatus Kapabacteria bacterium]